MVSLLSGSEGHTQNAGSVPGAYQNLENKYLARQITWTSEKKVNQASEPVSFTNITDCITSVWLHTDIAKLKIYIKRWPIG